jgi:lysophospholipase L1-like esterase
MSWWRFGAIGMLGAVMVVATAAPAGAAEQDREAQYLALGDSVAFGFSPLLNPRKEKNFVGYPEALAQELNIKLTNAACPGETTGGFISLTAADNGCRPYRENFPLHVNYKTTQLDFAIRFLESHRQTRLITIDIGVNDLFVLQRQCNGDTGCVLDGLPGLLNALSANLNTIYSRVRGEARYEHQIVALTYYTANYDDPVGVSVIEAINSTVAAATVAAHGQVADGFGAFKAVDASKGTSDSCVAGLLIRLSPTTCDVHPSPLGRDTLADALRLVVQPGD